MSLSVAAQLEGQRFIDSLVSEIPKVKDDTIKTRLYKKIVDQYANNNPTEAMRYAAQGMAHVTAMKWKKGVAVFNNLTGSLYSDRGEYVKAIEMFDKATAFHLADKDFFNAASALNNTGTAYLRLSAMDKAVEKYFEALKLAEKINNQYLKALCLDNIGVIYFNQGDYAKTLQYQNKALAIFTAEKNSDGMAESCSSIGNTYQQSKDTLHARKYYNEAIALYSQTNNNTGLATVYTNLSNLYTDLAVNLGYKLKAQQIWNSLNPAFPVSIVNMGNIGLCYLDFARYDSLRTKNLPSFVPGNRNEILQKATEYLNQGIAISLQTGDMGNYSYLTGLRAEVNVEKEDFKKAYYDAKVYHDVNDSIYSQENKNKIAAVEAQREVAIRDKMIEVNKLALSAQRKQRIFLIAGLALVCFVGALLFRQNRLRKKINATLLQLNEELDNSNKVKAKFFAIISHDLRTPLSRLVSFLHLQQHEPGMLPVAQAAEQQQQITVSAENLLDNMETILLWSKGQMEHFKSVKKQIRAGDLFDKIEKSFADYNEIVFSFINPDNIILNTDEDYCYTIMHNLTANAVKALQQTAAASIEWKVWHAGSNTFISITDNGPGFPLKFITGWDQTNSSINGRDGLGMQIVKDMAQAIDCKVKCKNNENGAVAILQL